MYLLVSDLNWNINVLYNRKQCYIDSNNINYLVLQVLLPDREVVTVSVKKSANADEVYDAVIKKIGMSKKVSQYFYLFEIVEYNFGEYVYITHFKYFLRRGFISADIKNILAMWKNFESFYINMFQPSRFSRNVKGDYFFQVFPMCFLFTNEKSKTFCYTNKNLFLKNCRFLKYLYYHKSNLSISREKRSSFGHFYNF